jgi:hypothetical protein
LAVPGGRVETKSLLQEGTFGRVYRASYRTEDRSGAASEQVMVKTVSGEWRILEL